MPPVHSDYALNTVYNLSSLRNLKVLVIGLKGVAAEVCKNLILSGVHSLTMMDPEEVAPQDLHSQYFLNPKSVGENVSYST